MQKNKFNNIVIYNETSIFKPNFFLYWKKKNVYSFVFKPIICVVLKIRCALRGDRIEGRSPSCSAPFQSHLTPTKKG